MLPFCWEYKSFPVASFLSFYWNGFYRQPVEKPHISIDWKLCMDRETQSTELRHQAFTLRSTYCEYFFRINIERVEQRVRTWANMCANVNVNVLEIQGSISIIRFWAHAIFVLFLLYFSFHSNKLQSSLRFVLLELFAIIIWCYIVRRNESVSMYLCSLNERSRSHNNRK